MSKLKHIIVREYITRVRKKAFIIMTVLGPILFAALMIVPVWIATLEDQEEKRIAVIEFDNDGRPVPDSLMQLRNVFKNKPLLTFEYLDGMKMQQAEAFVKEGAYFGIIAVRHRVLFSGDEVSVELLAQKHPSMGIELHITNSIEEFLHDNKLLVYNVPPQVIKSLKTNVTLVTKRADKDGFVKQGDQNIKRAVGYASGFLIYTFIFFFGAQVMRGVVEEKTNRIIEVIITSVKPFQLMMGKIIGIGLVGLTQFLTWIVLTFFIVTGAESFLLTKQLKELQAQHEQPAVGLFDSPVATEVAPETASPEDLDISLILDKLAQIDFVLVIGMFLFYFIGGFLLYSAMFAAIGAAVDSETDTQQFMLPVTIPLIISIIVMTNAISNPEGDVAYWFSIIPFTSPVVMMARIGFAVPVADFVLSASLLIITFICMTWFSGKIYRTGILMYGKKVNYREIWKWMWYK